MVVIGMAVIIGNLPRPSVILLAQLCLGADFDWLLMVSSGF